MEFQWLRKYQNVFLKKIIASAVIRFVKLQPVHSAKQIDKVNNARGCVEVNAFNRYIVHILCAF